ncbi:hypothetical protein HU830_06170 [Lactobacillus sp. DCY120]|uniref:Uncharacterized protein n=1 Tax=Bombilactobacillus apium TaxID=2675299 RepID=A0A850R307_9LACO|nr:hypothetical protein [Bombilactobacillus apium]NVY96740.1 hypothetical protein [Bombilactobacillus apium]
MDYKSLVASVISAVQQEENPFAVFSRLLTLDGILKKEDALKTLGFKEKAIYKLLSENKTGMNDISLFIFHHNNKIEVRDGEAVLDKNDQLAAKFKFSKKYWTKICQDSTRRIDDEGKLALHLLKAKTNLNSVIDNIEFYLSHMAPIIYYVDEKVYSNFDYLSNLFTKRRRDQDKFLFPFLKTHALEQWSKEDIIFICFLDYLLSSGLQTRAEEFNGQQITITKLEKYLIEKHKTYLKMGVAEMDADFSSLSLLEKTEVLNREFKILSKNKIIYRDINGISLQKREAYLDALKLADSNIEVTKLQEMLCQRFNIKFNDDESYIRGIREYLAENIQNLRAAFLKLLEGELFLLTDAAHSDMAFSRFFSNIGQLLSLDKAKEYQKIIDLNPKNYFCYVVPGKNMLAKLPKLLVANINMAVTTRMLYNSWHYMPANFLNENLKMDKRDFYFSAVMADIANLDKYHHAGHVKMSINNTIRIPRSIRIHNKEYQALMDVRLMRQGDEEFSLSNLRVSFLYLHYLQILCQSLVNLVEEMKIDDFSLEQMSKELYSDQFDNLKGRLNK